MHGMFCIQKLDSLFILTCIYIYRHHRTDALSSAVVMFAIVGSYAGLPVLDPLGGLVVAGMIFKSSIEMTTSSLKELADRSIDADDLDKVKQTMIQMKVSCY